MLRPGFFRCPFELEGMKDNTIITLHLGTHRPLRLLDMRHVLRRFYADRTRTAIRFILPHPAWETARSNVELRPLILPYQADFLAADMDVRLYPYMRHQRQYLKRLWYWREKEHERRAARAFTRALRRCGHTLDDLVDVADAIEGIFKWKMDQGEKNPMMKLGVRETPQGETWLFKMDPSAFATFKDQERLKDPAVNNALFTIVKTPFYPREFGRYSNTRDVEIIVTRDVDVARLPVGISSKIRADSNLVHIRHGVGIHDPFRDQVPTGLWILGEEVIHSPE